MSPEYLAALMLSIAGAATPLAIAALGELVTEKSGVLNLGVEGMMLVGAVAAFATTWATGSPVLGMLAAMVAGVAASAVFGLLTLILLANQVATGLALTIFGIGLSAFVGQNFVGIPVEPPANLSIPGLSDIPFFGPVLFGQDPLVYVAIGLTIGVSWFLYRTKAGLVVRAVGENHDAAHALGKPVVLIRFLAVMFGGAMSGLAGSYLSLIHTPMWTEGITAGKGWIALALVVFATWKPGRALLGAYLFGGVAILQLHAQGWGIEVSSHILSALPYVATILVLVAISRDETRIRLNAPTCIGRTFHASG